MTNYYYILVMFLVSYAIRVTPFLLIREPIDNRFIQSFLYYIPYVTLSVMTFPAIMAATQSPWAGFLAFIVGIIVAWRSGNLFKVASSCVLTVLIVEFLVL